MVYRPDVDKRLCFVLMPFKPAFSNYYEQIIKPAANDAGLEALRSDEIYGTHAIIRDIWNSIWKACVVIADVTHRNPNVNYELGLCHALGVPTVLITQTMEDVPFDYQHRRCIVYQTQEVGWDTKLRQALTKTIQVALASSDDEDLQWPYDTYLLSETHQASGLLTGKDAMHAVVQGTTLSATAVAQAFGPDGVYISKGTQKGGHMTCRTGIEIAGLIHSSNPLEDRGIGEMHRVAKDMSDSVGDGTKLAIMIASAMAQQGQMSVETGSSPREVVRGMERAVNVAIEHVMGEAQVAQTKDIRNIAMTATHGDEKIASLIVEAMKRVGKDGVITTEYAVGGETALYISEGMQFDRGYLSPYFVTDSDRGECVLEDCYILISEERIASMRQVIPVLEQVAREGKPLLVIAGDVEGEALSTMVVNKLRGSLACAAVRAPGSGDNRKALLEDIAVFSGGRAFTEDLGASVVQARPIDLGKARKVVITKDTISLIEGAGAPEEISARAKMIRVMAESADTGSAEKLRERLARLVGGIARIQAGGVTDEDALDQAYKIQSAMFASNAITAGWVSGGGLALLRAKKAVDRLTCQEEGENAGTRSVAYALMQPISRLVENSGRSPTQLVHQIQEQAALVNGFNAKSGKVENLDEAGVIEPARLLVQTLRIAFSHTREILLTGAWDVTP